jgi:hypothetical protein
MMLGMINTTDIFSIGENASACTSTGCRWPERERWGQLLAKFAIFFRGARWGRWLADTPEGRVICRRWKEWVGAQVKKYDWDVDDADHPTIHGLRGTGILTRAEQGYEVDQIANDIGMSRQNVEHYMRFKDQMKVGADGQKRLRLVNKED